MSTTPTMTPAPPMPKPRKRWWLRGLLAFMALAVIVPLGLFAYWTISTRGAWARAEEEADQDDPGWRLADIEADRPKIADADNSALKMMAMVRGAGRVSVSGVPNYELMFDKLPVNAQLNTQQVQLIRTEFAKMPKPLAEARSLKDMPEGRFPIAFSNDWISTVIQHHQDARTVADWLKHDAMLLAQEGDCDGAIESCQAAINGGRAMKDDPFLITALVRLAIQNIALESLERVLAQGEPSEERLRQMQAMLEREMQESSFLQGIRGERAGAHFLFENIRDGKVKPNLMTMVKGGGGLDSINDWITDKIPSTMLKHYPDHLHNMNRMVAAAKLPLHERAPKLAEVVCQGKDSGNVVSRLLMPWLDKVEKADRRGQIYLRTMVVALACERYRLKQNDKRWPRTLDDLVQAKLLSAIPTDPIDNQPLRYRRTADGIVVYSLGFDAKDDQGKLGRDRYLDPGVDLGYRLWNPEQRRQAPLPPVGLPAGN